MARRMSAKQRKYFGRRTVRRAASTVRRVYRRGARATRRSYRRSSRFTGGWVPYGIPEMAITVGVGAVAPKAVSLVKQIAPPQAYQWAGAYQNQLILGVLGAAANKFGGNGALRIAGRKAFDAALLGTGAQLGSQYLGITGTTASGSSSAAWA